MQMAHVYMLKKRRSFGWAAYCGLLAQVHDKETLSLPANQKHWNYSSKKKINRKFTTHPNLSNFILSFNYPRVLVEIDFWEKQLFSTP